jgi:hypothetical protein
MSVVVWMVPVGLSGAGAFLWGASWLEAAVIRPRPVADPTLQPALAESSGNSTEGGDREAA